MKHIFIVNPAAGKGTALEFVPKIKEYFSQNEADYKIIYTEYAGHATEIAREYSSGAPARIYSVGGDGTVNEVVNGIAGTQSVLGVIPAGSGNDFIRSIDNNLDAKKLLIDTIEGEARRIDLGRVNEKFFINISSIGFDAEVVYNAMKFKRIPLVPASLAYLFSIIYTCFKRKISEVSLNIDGQLYDKSLLLAAVANGRFYGGGMLPLPEAELSDGLFDICLVDKVSRRLIISFFPKYIKGTHGSMKQVKFMKAQNVHIKSNDMLCVNIDGEITTSKEVTFEILQGAIRVIYPASLGRSETSSENIASTINEGREELLEDRERIEA